MSTIADEVASESKPALGSLTRPTTRSSFGGLTTAAAWIAVAALAALWPDESESGWAYAGDFAALCGALAVVSALAALFGVRFPRLRRVQRLSPWLIALALFLATWEAVTAKLGLLRLLFFRRRRPCWKS